MEIWFTVQPPEPQVARRHAVHRDRQTQPLVLQPVGRRGAAPMRMS